MSSWFLCLFFKQSIADKARSSSTDPGTITMPISHILMYALIAMTMWGLGLSKHQNVVVLSASVPVLAMPRRHAPLQALKGCLRHNIGRKRQRPRIATNDTKRCCDTRQCRCGYQCTGYGLVHGRLTICPRVLSRVRNIL